MGKKQLQRPSISLSRTVKDGKPIKDSGKRENFATGSVRDSREGKGRFDLLPMFALEQLSKHFECGALKYGERNWEKGQKLSRYLDSGLRHLSKAARGQTDEDHFSAAAWNIMCLIDTKRQIELGMLSEELNDLRPELPESVQSQL